MTSFSKKNTLTTDHFQGSYSQFLRCFKTITVQCSAVKISIVDQNTWGKVTCTEHIGVLNVVYFSIVQGNKLQYSVLHYSAVQCGTITKRAVQLNQVTYSTEQYGIIKYFSTQ